VEVTQANRSQVGAPETHPEATGQHDMEMRLHESAINNYSASLLSGATAKQTKADGDLKFDVELPKWMDRFLSQPKPENPQKSGDEQPKAEEFRPYSLTLQHTRPISVQFGNNQLKLTLHIAVLKSGDQVYDEGWDVSGTYQPELKDGRVVLTRQGELEVLPSDFSGESVTVEESGKRNNLREEFENRSKQGRGFPQTVELEPLKPEGQLAKAGPLDYQTFTVGDGWLTVALDRHSKHVELPTPTPNAGG
jgi:hypothetical protein